MKRAGVLTIMAILFASALVGCGGGEEEAVQEEEEAPGEEAVAVGGFAVVGPNEEVIELPAIIAERSDIEVYLDTVRLVLEDTARALSRQIDPSAELQNQTLTLSIGVESVEEARAKTDDGLVALQLVEPPEDLEPVHELLIAAYVQGVAAYDNIIDAFESGDLEVLTGALRENLPEIEQLTAETRSILQELERAQTVNSDD